MKVQRYSKLWKSKRFNEMCVVGGGEISGSRCDVASSWCLSCLCFLQLMVYREFFMDIMRVVVAIPLCFGSFSFVIMELYITERCPVVLGELSKGWWCSSEWVGICGSLCCARFIQTPTNTGSMTRSCAKSWCAYGERPTWAAPMTLTSWCILWHFA